MVDIVFQEEGVIHPSVHQRLVVCQSDDVLGKHVVGGNEGVVHLIPPVVSRTVQRIAEVEHMLLGEAVVQVGPQHSKRTLHMSLREGPSIDLVTLTAYPLTVPVVFAVCGVSSHRMIPRMRQ